MTATRTLSGRITTAAAVALVLGGHSPTWATPQLAARYGQDCHLCHTNPTGGGLRNAYTSQLVVPYELSLKPLSAHQQEAIPNPQITPHLTVGADLRLLYYATDQGGENAFYQMQGDLYTAFEPLPELALYLDKSIRSGFEAFILARVLPWHGYVKGGRYRPDIGWRWDDHKRITRRELGLDASSGPADETGIEIGVSPGVLAVSAGVFNGNGFDAPTDNTQKMVVGRFLVRQRVAEANVAVGGSVRHNRTFGARELVIGGQGSVALGPVMWLGDFFRRTTEDVADGHEVNSWFFTQEVAAQATQGAGLYVAFGFLDPDLDRESGTETHWTFGARVYPLPYLKLEPLVRIHDYSGEGGHHGQRPSNDDDDGTLTEFDVVIHGYF